MGKTITYKTTIKCPICKYKKEVEMPEYARLMVYDCKECSARLKPKANECCVFCSYGSTPCPPAQRNLITSQTKGEA